MLHHRMETRPVGISCQLAAPDLESLCLKHELKVRLQSSWKTAQRIPTRGDKCQRIRGVSVPEAWCCLVAPTLAHLSDVSSS